MSKVLLFLSLLATTIPAALGASSSSAYSILHDGFDGGGGTVSSSSFTVDGSLGGVSGLSKASASGVSLGFGFGGVLTPIGLINTPPVLQPISNKTVEEGTVLTFSAVASDPDGPFDPIRFSLTSIAPAGASINPTTGVFSWTPTEAQGPSVMTMTVTVSDTGSPSLSASQSFTVTVVEANSAPRIATLAPQAVIEGRTLTFSVAAEDPDIPANAFIYLLGADAPIGASINPITGVFTWTPTEPQGPSVNAITVTVSDNGTPSLSTTQTITVTVSEENTPPIMAGLADQTIVEGQPLTALAAAVDRDLPAQALAFRLAGSSPAGASIDPTTGVLKWTPSEEQGPGTYTVTVEVADNASPGLTASQSFKVVVIEANTSPEMPAIPRQTISESNALRIPVNAVDRDLPRNGLEFSLGPDAPSGAGIDRATGIFSWTPTEEQGPGQYRITINVADDATPRGSASQTFTVDVAELNTAPTLSPVSDRTIRAGTILNLKVVGADADVPPNDLTFHLGPGAPSGASIDGPTGVFSWTPPPSAAETTHSIAIRVSDNGTPSLEATQTVNVVVTPSNLPPVFEGVPSQISVREGEPFALSIAARDTDVPPHALQFQLGFGAPSGMSLDPSLGQLAWTPNEGQGPSTNLVTILVADDGIPPLAATNRIQIVVGEVNQPPTLAPISDKTVEAEDLLSVVTSASDLDLPANRLTFSLAADAPAGATVAPATGVFSWRPTLLQGPATNRMTVVVTDDGSPPLSTNRTFTVVVTRRNQTPVLAVIPGQTVDEGRTLTFTAKATDLDQPGQSLIFSLVPGVPVGMSINRATGVCSWTPTEAQGPSTNVIAVRVTDNGSPPLAATQNVTLVANEVNEPPTLGPIHDQTIGRGDTLRLTVKASDPDLPANVLRFSLEPNAPTGAGIDPTTGVLTWPSTAAQAPSTNVITLRVSDNGIPPLSDTKNFVVVVRTGVNQPPAISQISNQTTDENTPTAAIAFTINDPDTPLENLNVIFTSSDPDLIPVENIASTGTGTNRLAVITPAVNQIGTASITASVQDNTGASARTTFDLIVRGRAPTIVRQPRDATVVAGTPVTLDVTAVGTLPLAYQWRFNGNDVPGATNSIVALSSARLEDAGIYSVVVSNRVGSLTSTGARLTVSVPLRITRQPASQNVLLGVEAGFSVVATGVPPLSYQWRLNEVSIPGGTNSTLNLRNVEAILAGNYSVVVRDAAGGTATSGPATLTVITPVTITEHPQTQTVAEGTNVMFSVLAIGVPAPRYQWQFNGVDLPGQTNAALQLANVTVSHAGEYLAVASNPVGSTNSAQAILTISTRPGFTRPPQSQTAKIGDSVTFTVTASGSQPLQYQWRFRANTVGPAGLRRGSSVALAALPPAGSLPGTEIAGATGPTLTISNIQLANEGEYFVVVSNAVGTATSEGARLTVSVPAAITQQPQSQKVAAESAVSFGVAAAGSGPLAYQWRHNGVDIPGATNAALTLARVLGTDAGNYQVLVANPAGSLLSGSAALAVDLPVTIVGQPQSQLVSNGASALFTVAAVGSGTLSYQWRFEGQNIAGATGPSLAIQSVQVANAGRYSVEVRNPVGPVTSEEAVLAVIIPPTIQTQPANSTVSPGASVTFTVGASGDEPLSYQWQKNGNKIPGATNATYAISSVEAADQGTYGVVAQNPGGAVTSDPATLSVVLPPIASGKTAQEAPPPVVASEGTFDGGSNEAGAGLLARKSVAPKVGEERWFSWRAPSSGIAVFTTKGSTFDTVMTIYSGTPSNLKEVGRDDDSGAFLSSLVQFNAVGGTTYLISVKGFGGAAGRIVVNFKLQTTTQKLPEIISPPQSQTVPPGQAVTLRVDALGSDMLYQWFANGAAIANAVAPTYTIPSVSEAHALRYTVKITGDSSSASPITVESAPAFVQIGTTDSAAVDKLKSLPRPGAPAQLLSLGGGRAKSSVGSYPAWLAFSTLGATKEQGEPNHCDEAGGASAWMWYQAPRDGTVRVSTEGSDFDTVLAVYTGPGTDFASLKLEACDNNSGADGKASVATVQVRQGAAYYVAVDGVKGATGRVKLSYELGAGPVIAEQPASQSVVLGQSFALTVQLTNTLSGVPAIVPGVKYQWQKDGLPLAGQTKNSLQVVRAQLADAGDYAVEVSNFAGATTSQVARVTVNVPLSITVSPAGQAVKPGSAASFEVTASGTPPVAYQWRLNGTDLPGATNATLQILNMQAVNVGSYTVLAQNPAGSVESAPAVLTLNTAPAITAPPVDQVTVLNGTATFAVTAVGTPSLRYQWRHNGADIAGAQAANLVLNNVGSAQVGEYTVVISNNADSVVSTSAKLALRIPLTLLEEPQSQAAGLGSSVIFNVRVAGPGPFLFQWKKNGLAIAGATGPVLTQPNVQAGDAGQYTVVVTSGADAVESRPATLTVSAAPVITEQPSNQAVFAGTNVTFSVAATGTGPLTYQWFKESAAIAGATSSTLALTNVHSADAGSYAVTVSNAGGSVGSASAVLTVQQMVSELRFDAAAGFQFRLNVPEGKRATVQVSADLIHWTSFTPIPVTGVMNIHDPRAAASELQFYRVIVE